MRFKIKRGYSVSECGMVNDDELSGLDENERINLVENKVYDVWQKRWDECESGRVTYEFIKDVRFAEMNVLFEPSLWMGYILTGHGSMNAFLYKRGLSESAGCVCGAECEDWKHALIECPLYGDLRELSEWDVSVRADGSVNVDDVLECKEWYERVSKFATCVFERRRMSGNA